MKNQSEIINKKFSYRRNPKHPIFVTGTYGLYTYKAKVLNNSIKEGIANGRVIQLKVLSNGLELVFYDEGWYYGKDYLSIYVPIVKKLERIKRKEGIKR
ncbi:hypothetical protein HPK19_19520 [Arthrobacter citreus]|nr:hypothetical protein HPK19_19520 [Arthrobacter citreus]